MSLSLCFWNVLILTSPRPEVKHTLRSHPSTYSLCHLEVFLQSQAHNHMYCFNNTSTMCDTCFFSVISIFMIPKTIPVTQSQIYFVPSKFQNLDLRKCNGMPVQQRPPVEKFCYWPCFKFNTASVIWASSIDHWIQYNVYEPVLN